LSFFIFFLLIRPPPTSTLFPYTTLFRSLRSQYRSGGKRSHYEAAASPHITTTSSNHRSRGLIAIVLAQPVDLFTALGDVRGVSRDRKSTRLNSSHLVISYAVFCLKKKK